MTWSELWTLSPTMDKIAELFLRAPSKSTTFWRCWRASVRLGELCVSLEWCREADPTCLGDSARFAW